MIDNKFNKAPLSPLEKEKKAEAFLEDVNYNENKTTKSMAPNKTVAKESVKVLPLRIPVSIFDNLREVSALSGISMNAICLELIRPHIKEKLKELKD